MIRETWLSALTTALLACEVTAETEEEKALMGVLSIAKEEILSNAEKRENGRSKEKC